MAHDISLRLSKHFFKSVADLAQSSGGGCPRIPASEHGFPFDHSRRLRLQTRSFQKLDAISGKRWEIGGNGKHLQCSWNSPLGREVTAIPASTVA